MSDDDWVPPHARPDEVAGLPAAPVAEKWAPYSKSYQGIASLAVAGLAARYFRVQLPDAQAQMIADFAVQSLLLPGWALLSIWWAAKGRAKAQAMLYWLPRTREKKLSAATGVPVERLLKF